MNSVFHFQGKLGGKLFGASRSEIRSAREISFPDCVKYRKAFSFLKRNVFSCFFEFGPKSNVKHGNADDEL